MACPNQSASHYCRSCPYNKSWAVLACLWIMLEDQSHYFLFGGVLNLYNFNCVRSARLDGLMRREENEGLKIIETFTGRDDRLVYRSATYITEGADNSNQDEWVCIHVVWSAVQVIVKNAWHTWRIANVKNVSVSFVASAPLIRSLFWVQRSKARRTQGTQQGLQKVFANSQDDWEVCTQREGANPVESIF